MKAVENGGTAIGIRCKDGVVLAVEKIITSKLLKPGANKKIATVDRHVGIVRALAERETERVRAFANGYINRCQLGWLPMADTLSPEPEMRLPSGGAYTRPQYPSPPLQTVWAAMSRLSHFTPACGHSASPPSSAAGTQRLNRLLTARWEADRVRALAVRLKARSPGARVYI